MDASRAATDGAQSLPSAVVQRFCAGDITVLDDLLQHLQQVAWYVARMYVPQEEVAADLIQDAFVRAYERRAQYDPSRPFQAWFLTIVRNRCLDHLRRCRGHATLDAASPLQVSTSAEENLNRNEQRVRIASIMAAIPEPYREYLRLRDELELSPQDITAMTGVDYNTTRWRIHKARQLFRSLWLERYGELEP